MKSIILTFAALTVALWLFSPRMGAATVPFWIVFLMVMLNTEEN